MRPRVLPVMLIADEYVVKTTAFRKPVYVGDPINTVKLYNEKRADEIIVLDINASLNGRGVDFAFVETVVSEAFMPVAYGGGVESLQDVLRLVSLGVEKVVLNRALFTKPHLLSEAADHLGVQAMIANMDVRTWRRKKCRVVSPTQRSVTRDPAVWASELERAGAGEVLVTSVDREGSREGYDLDLIKHVSAAVRIPLVANGGAGELAHFPLSISAGASAVAAGTMFTFREPRKAVLITYPNDEDLTALFTSAEGRQ